ncbi:hypothetical protein KA107_02385 [Candidatus Pacearchaeota archaeon]|nr:hypothetical protein [Candidatus Pacearchaeota archaeon]
MNRLGILVSVLALYGFSYYAPKFLLSYAEKNLVVSKDGKVSELEKQLRVYPYFAPDKPASIVIPRMSFHFSVTEGTNLWDLSYTDNNEGTNRDVAKTGFYLKNPTNEFNFRFLTSNEIVMAREVIGKTLGAYQSSTNLAGKK